MSKHTPGPWEVVDCLKEGVVDERANVALLGRYRIVCDTKHGSLSETEDANLIAAAPDLLEALRTVQHFIGDDQIRHAIVNHPDEPELALGDYIKAAIAKAVRP